MKSNPTTRVTRSVTHPAQASVVPAPATGLEEAMPVVGIVIDYDYARAINTLMERTSVRCLLNCSILVLSRLFFLSGNLTFYVNCRA